MNTKKLFSMTLLLMGTVVAGCNVPGAEDDAEEETISEEQAVRICKLADCGGQEPTLAVKEMGRNLAREVFEGRDGIDEDKAGAVIVAKLFDPQPVSEAERRQICSRTGGRFATKVVVGECLQNGEAYVLPVGDGFDPKPQPQKCTVGRGHTYHDQCVYTDIDGLYYFDDGPSIPPQAEAALPFRFTTEDIRYSILFWAAGQQHDYCYHHTQVYSAHKIECDDNFDRKMHQICTNEHRGLFDLPYSSFSRGTCKTAAKAMTAAVRYFGADAFLNMKTYVRYLHKPEPQKPQYPDNQGPVAEPEVACAIQGEVVYQGACVCPFEPRAACVNNPIMRWVDVPGTCGNCEVNPER